MAALFRVPVLAAIVAGLTAFPLGLLIMVRASSGPLHDSDVALIQVHGTVQILGWAGLFIVGVASHAVPRFFGNTAIPFPWPQRLTVVLIVAGLGLRALAQPGTWLPYRDVLLTTAGLAIAAGWLVFAWTLFVVLRAGSEGQRMVAGWFWLGLAGAAGAALAYLGLSIDLAARVEVDRVAFVDPAWNTAFQQIALFGFILPFTFGFSARAVAAFLRLPPRDLRADRAAMVLVALGTLLAALGASGGHGHILSRAGALLIAAAIVIFTLALRILPPLWSGQPLADRWLHRYAGTAYAWLLVGAVLIAVGAVAPDGSWSVARTASLHVVTVGFLTTLILGFAHKALPLLSRHPLPLPGAVPVAFGLLQLGVALRLAGNLLGPVDIDPSVLRMGGVFSLLGFVAGVVPLAVLLLRSNPDRTPS
ncbi:MAG: NnrS family protein [Dehalococcoidia bacterium]|nr:NnrS family protein [Dehalococcoidia bacterium]